jgi:Na+/H+ antiporter NhaA
MSNRKKALIALATIEGILNLAIIVLFVFQKLSLMGFLVAFGLVTLLTLLAIFIVIRKTDPE